MQEQLPRVLSVPFPLRFLFASHPAVIGQDDPVPRSTGMCESGHGQGAGHRLPHHCRLLERDGENSYLTSYAGDNGPMDQLLEHSITYRIAVGPQQGRKVFTLQTLPDCSSDNPVEHAVGKVAGFSLHAGVAAKAHERAKLERLCRYIARPAVSTKRLSLTRNGQVRYELKTPWRNGTTHVIFEPLDFMYRMYGMPRAQGCA
jgi:hypothetical protein